MSVCGRDQNVCVWDHAESQLSSSFSLKEHFLTASEGRGGGIGVVDVSDRYLLFGKVLSSSLRATHLALINLLSVMVQATTVLVIDSVSGTLRHTLAGHTSTITFIKIFDTQFSAAIAATGSYDGTVRVWDLRT